MQQGDSTALGAQLVAEAEDALRLAADLREQIARDRQTVQALREYLSALHPQDRAHE